MPQALPHAVILAGGAGRRMGGNKPFYPFKGVPLIEAVMSALRPQSRVVHVNAGVREGEVATRLAQMGYPMCYDDAAFADLGPLSGIRTALVLAAGLGEDRVVTAPCDMPELPGTLVERLLAADHALADVTYVRGARDYPLCALWKVSLLPHLEAALRTARSDGGLSVMRYLSTCQACTVEVEDDDCFININTPVNGAQAE